MKTQLKFGMFILLAVAISSCKDDDGSNIAFSELSVEENKQVVENSAISAARDFDALKDLSVVDASVSLGIRFDIADPLSSNTGKKSKVTSTIELLAGLETDETGIHELLNELKSPGNLKSDPETIQDVWDEIVGTYTWNFTNENWDYTANPDAIVFHFPSNDNGTSNNAVLTISNYTGVIITSPVNEDYDGDLPASLDMDLTIDGTIVMTYTFAAEYNSDGIPSSIATDLTTEPYKFSIDITNNDKEVSASYKFTKNGDIVMEISGGVEGDFTQENIDNNTVIHTNTWEWTDYVYNEATGGYDEVIRTEVDEWEEVDMEEIAQSGNFKFQLYDISINGIGDIKALVDSMDLIYPENYWNIPGFDEKEATELEVSLLNNNLHMYAVDEEANRKIAEVNAYLVMESYGGSNYDYWVDFRLEFGDGSFVDLETYFEEGFEDFIAEINSMIYDLNSEYGWDIETIDY